MSRYSRQKKGTNLSACPLKLDKKEGLHVEAEVHDVAVLNDVVLALDTHLAGFTDSGF